MAALQKIPSKWYELGPFTLFDVETTGMSPVYDRIIEIAAVRIEKDGIQARFHSLVNPGRKVPPQISTINNITDDMLVGAPTFRKAAEKFIDFAKESALVAHNARFDLSFLQESLFREGMEIWNGKTLDTIPIIKNAYQGLPSYSLQNLRFSFGLGNGFEGPAHRAFADVEWTLEIFSMAMQELIKRTS